MHSSEEDPRVYSFKGLFQIQEEEGKRALIYAFTMGGPSEAMEITNQVHKRVFGRPSPPEPSLSVWQDSLLFNDEVQAWIKAH